MEFFDSFVLYQSSEHIALLHYILMLVYFIFLPFSGIVFSGTILSLYYKRRGEKEQNKELTRLAKIIVEITTINKSAGVVLGIVPALSILLIYSQLLHASGSYIISFLFLSFVLYSAGIILIYIYRYAMVFNDLMENTQNKIEDEVLNEEYKKISAGTENLKDKTGVLGFVFLLVSILLMLGCITLSIYTTRWTQVQNVFVLLFSADAWLRFLFFISTAVTITAGYLLFMCLYWKDTSYYFSDIQKDLIRSISVKLLFVFSLPQPIFLFLGLYTLPDASLSSTIFIFTGFAVLLIFLALNIAYLIARQKTIKYSGYIVIVFALVFATGIIKDQLAMSNSNSVHALVLNSEYIKHIQELQASGGTENLGVSGEMVFKKVCSTCHKFDQKLVGPPYKVTLPKYEGKMDALVAYISNPEKKNPAYPAMPNQGLQKNEAKAVAKYIMENYKK